MAVVNVSSSIITGLDAVPVVKSNAQEIGGRIRGAAAFADFAASDATSVARLLRLPSRARIHRVVFASDDLGTGGTVDVGVHQTTANGGAVVDADVFASAIDTDTAAVARTDITLESAVIGIEKCQQKLWQWLGLSADSNRDYDITVTRNTAAGTGTVALWIDYVLD